MLDRGWVFFHNCLRVKSSLLSLELSFSITAVILAADSILCDNSKLRGSIIKRILYVFFCKSMSNWVNVPNVPRVPKMFIFRKNI